MNFNNENLNQILKKIAKRYKIKSYIDFDEISPKTIEKLVMAWDVPLDWFHENSYIVGSQELVLGFYKDPERKAISFFHELGHLIISNQSDFEPYSPYIEEIEATIKGIELAKLDNFKFSDSAIYWMISQSNNCLNKKLSNRRKQK